MMREFVTVAKRVGRLTSSDPTRLEVIGGRSDLNFSSGFNVVFTSQALSDEFVAIAPPIEGFARLSSGLREVAEHVSKCSNSKRCMTLRLYTLRLLQMI